MRGRQGGRFLGLYGWFRAATLAAVLLAPAAGRPARAQPADQDAHPATRPAATRPAEAGYWLRVTAHLANLRSRPDANSLPVAALKRGALLRATGGQFGWHRVRPPAGTFSLVSARYIERLPGDVGTVSIRSGSLRVRVGSQLLNVDPLKCEVQARLPRGAQVSILGERDGWLRIVPPADVYMYISDKYVTRISADVAARLRKTRSADTRPGASPARSGPDAAKPQPTTGPPDLRGPWGQRLLLVEAAIQAEARKPALEQSWTESIARLRPIATQRAEPTVATLAAAWIARLEQRLADQAALRTARDLARRAAREKAQAARELERIRRARRALASRAAFDLRGELRRSFAPGNKKTPQRFKLQDPLSGRVLAYLEFPEKAGIDPLAYVGKYVGVRGRRLREPALGADLVRVAEITLLAGEVPTSQSSREKRRQ